MVPLQPRDPLHHALIGPVTSASFAVQIIEKVRAVHTHPNAQVVLLDKVAPFLVAKKE